MCNTEFDFSCKDSISDSYLRSNRLLEFFKSVMTELHI